MTAFLNITGQVIYSKIMEAYLQEAFVVSKLVDTIPTRLDGEKIRKALINMRAAGIKSFGFFILGYPGDTRESLERTIDHLASTVEKLTDRMEAPTKWVGGRATALVDRWLPIGVLAVIVLMQDRL